MKKLLAVLLAVIMVLTISACSNKESTNSVLPTESSSVATTGDFQKNMHQTTTSNIPYLCESENGYYIQDYNVMAYYIDKETKTATILCAKPDCIHKDDTCNAYMYCHSLSYFNNKLYFSNDDRIVENGTVVNYGERLYSMNLDGTNHSTVQDLEFMPSGDTSEYITSPIIHRGNVYFVYSGVLYSVPVGGDIDNATTIWGEKIAASTGGITIVNPNAIHYELWADGDYLYFMVNLKQPNGTYKDTLFAYDTGKKEVRQVWQTPAASDVGEWETTGVSVSQWYVMDGYIYFYLSGGDMWRSNLETGKHEKLADVSEKTKCGTAIFSDQYMCLLNDTLSNYVNGLSGAYEHTGGDTIYVYGLDGTFVKELSLKPLFNSISQIEHFEMAFCSENDIYFVANASTWGNRVNSISSIVRNLILCCVNIESGKITQIYAWN